ncbi:hypothetical protein KGF56_004691 [Candida oxycetoniae]|uniref:RNase III domain-containing protein n=1 Tax=Candida oxycetoniae TaxID=497107 RepID=A0AAI9STX7_9ASCO|nr:uncharacterized protein KGF56_004691 [Candida oxycetoniae]KAI3402599.2 hypothetical protein KGF56_004691 [Candida oxycetoniae]
MIFCFNVVPCPKINIVLYRNLIRCIHSIQRLQQGSSGGKSRLSYPLQAVKQGNAKEVKFLPKKKVVEEISISTFVKSLKDNRARAEKLEKLHGIEQAEDISINSIASKRRKNSLKDKNGGSKHSRSENQPVSIKGQSNNLVSQQSELGESSAPKEQAITNKGSPIQDNDTTTSTDWSTFLLEEFRGLKKNKTVDLGQTRTFEAIMREYSCEALVAKKQLEYKQKTPNYKSFKFFNYDLLDALGTGSKHKPLSLYQCFVKNDCKKIRFQQIEESELVVFTGFTPVNVFAAMVYLEDKDYDYLILKFLTPIADRNELEKIFNNELFINEYIEKVSQFLSSNQIALDLTLFAQVTKSPFLITLPNKLPPIPKFHNQILYKFFGISLVVPDFELYEKNKTLKRLVENLDVLGDTVLKRYSAEFLIHYSKMNPNFKWNMDDLHFLNTNIIFNRLSLAYKLHEGVTNVKYREYMRKIITEKSLDIANEMLGDIFERLVAILYLDEPETCRNWMFEIYNCILENLKTTKQKVEFIDKQKYLTLYQYHLKNSTMY